MNFSRIIKAVGNEFYHLWITGVEKYGDLVQDIAPMKIVFTCLFFIAALLGHGCTIYPWILWKHICMDTVILLMFPILLAIFADEIGDICEYSSYESLKLRNDIRYLLPDVELQVWEDTKYYKYVGNVGSKFVSIGYNLIDTESGEEIEGEMPEEEAHRNEPQATDDTQQKEISTLELRHGKTIRRQLS